MCECCFFRRVWVVVKSIITGNRKVEPFKKFDGKKDVINRSEFWVLRNWMLKHSEMADGNGLAGSFTFNEFRLDAHEVALDVRLLMAQHRFNFKWLVQSRTNEMTWEMDNNTKKRTVWQKSRLKYSQIEKGDRGDS